MRATTSVITLVALALTASACGVEDTTAPLGTERTESPVAAGLDTPAQSQGAIITNDQSLTYFVNFDADRGLVAIHGIYVEICESDPFTLASRTRITTPSAVLQELVRISAAEEPVVIYRSETGAVSCALALSPEVRVGEGMVHHDQVLSLASFKSTWRGEVTAPDGSTHHYTEVYQLTGDLHDPNNPTLWSVNAAKILVH